MLLRTARTAARLCSGETAHTQSQTTPDQFGKQQPPHDDARDSSVGMQLHQSTTTKFSRWRATSSKRHRRLPEHRSRTTASGLTYPKRAVAVTLPVHMDDGSTESLSGLPRPTSPHARPDQRRHAVRAFIVDGRNGRAGHVDELEMRAGAVALRRRQRRRGRAIRPNLSRQRARKRSRAVTCRK